MSDRPNRSFGGDARKLLRRSSHQLILGISSFLLFIIISFLVLRDVTQAADAQLALAINEAAMSAPFTTIMVIASLYGREYFWIPIVAGMLLMGKPGTKLLAIELAALFVVGIGAGELLKSTFYRPHPFDAIVGIVTRVGTDSDSSFPSGHALITSIGASFAIKRFKKVAFLPLVLETAIVCYSRVYVGMHYPLDVIGGVLLGMVIVLLGLFVLEESPLRHILEYLVALFERILKASRIPELF